jgi:hypothetical protein
MRSMRRVEKRTKAVDKKKIVGGFRNKKNRKDNPGQPVLSPFSGRTVMRGIRRLNRQKSLFELGGREDDGRRGKRGVIRAGKIRDKW